MYTSYVLLIHFKQIECLFTYMLKNPHILKAMRRDGKGEREKRVSHELMSELSVEEGSPFGHGICSDCRSDACDP